MTSKQLRNKLRREKKKNEQNKMVLESKRVIAVYGNLRKGGNDHKKELKDANYLGTFDSVPEYQLLDIGNYPALIKGNASVKMEVYEISKQRLAEISEIECCFDYNSAELNQKYSLTKKELIETPFGAAILYVYNQPEDVEKASPVKSGDWIDYMQTQHVNKLLN